MHVDIEPTQIGRVFGPDLGIVSDARAALALFIEVAHEMKADGNARRPFGLGGGLPAPQAQHAAQDPFRLRAAEAAAGL